MIPDYIDVLIAHGPPADILDKVTRGINVGCKDLKNKVQIIQPQYHIFGHIHESSGIKIEANTTFINVSVVNEHYKKVNDGFDFVIDDGVKSN
jgi:Icc-related predicted phosphoesterase